MSKTAVVEDKKRSSLVAQEHEHYKKRPQRIKHGKWFVTELAPVDFPRRLLISPIPYTKAIEPRRAEVAVKGWYATGYADKAWIKLVALTQHARSEKRVGVYLLYMCREYMKRDIDPKKVEEMLSAKEIREILEDFAEYETLIMSMQLDDGMKRLRTYDIVTKERSKTKKVLSEEYAAALASKWSMTEKFVLPSQVRYGWHKLIPTKAFLKKLVPWVAIMGFLILAALVWSSIL
jgi:hypothetical protein